MVVNFAEYLKSVYKVMIKFVNVQKNNLMVVEGFPIDTFLITK